jgi:hypothetical protein
MKERNPFSPLETRVETDNEQSSDDSWMLKQESVHVVWPEPAYIMQKSIFSSFCTACVRYDAARLTRST